MLTSYIITVVYSIIWERTFSP